ncbi:hypothetical protein GDO86_010907 [Hymenochirus boettgeri]|uniref:C2H2-type domain-containing protein n=1 Tax=Hymenochirus boettgeri TaxID=247094 RepID=A0A8T2JC34_9PIPI|nr:hypothetical protein GDO86_010907 [Hymenochirus boettgeri]
MQSRRLSKRSILGNDKVNTSEPTPGWSIKGATLAPGEQAVSLVGAEDQREEDIEEVMNVDGEKQRTTCNGRESVQCNLKGVSSNIDVPHARIIQDEGDMDKVTAAMVLTSLSSSPMVRSLPVHVTDVNGSLKESGFAPSSIGSSGCWSWNTPSDCSNPSTPSPPLSSDGWKYFQFHVHSDDNTEDTETSSLLFDEPVPRKRKNSMKVMFKCLWKTCEKVLSTSAGIKKHIRTIHLGRIGEFNENEGEEDFYYTEIRLNTDSVMAELQQQSPDTSPLQSPLYTLSCSDNRYNKPIFITAETKGNALLSHSAPSAFCLLRPDHSYQTTAPIKMPKKVNYIGKNVGGINNKNVGVSWILSPVTFGGSPVSLPTNNDMGDPKLPTTSSSLQKAGFGIRKFRGEGKKCRKVYGMENRDKWCTACRWKKACQRFPD